ncbi:DNA alkylation repair protein [Anaerotignum sp. MB30-C6]|uniref:DNA alkylation repair protein n=1 Tax=Anaerotignum sp. MB30-C6 TaxID=3070814 RepID=UPI0027DBF6A0|nr:DNA alkylation repair protein [Anaerotignum sp. MB30-C6]WMI82322.1 DNA alkylation repair protein [Anaerotignum sp. MB30-C6]
MDEKYMQYLIDTVTEKDNLKFVKEKSFDFYKTHTIDECFDAAVELYQSKYFQIQEIGVFLCGYIGTQRDDATAFLKNVVSQHDSWKVQEVLAMAFDIYCKSKGYEKALPEIQEWLNSDCANVRRAALEGLRIWTSRPYFKDFPEVAIKLLAVHRNDKSEYFRKSVGNALRDISKKFPDLIKKELDTWDTSSKQVMQVFKLAGKFVYE